MESPPGTPLLEEEDEAVPCKGCNNVLEEGKAFELAGNRWHIECFRCNSCGTLLDSDANLLLLGDGSLICNSCTYSCTACGNKIEDLAILTGDQAFCAGCFRCRNCKRKIENLKYARTSQGIFCMTCHEILMARRKKRPKPTMPQRPTPSVSPMLALDKALPSVPPPQGDDPVELPATIPRSELPANPPPRPPASRSNLSRTGPPPDQLSPMAFQPSGDHLRTPRANKRHSQMSLEMLQGAQDYSFIPLVLDNSPGHTPAQLPGTSYTRSNVLDRGPHHDRAELPRKSSTDMSHYEARGTIPHIATQDKSYELPVVMDRKDIPRTPHDNERPSDKQSSSRSDASLNKSDAQASRDQSRSPEDNKAERSTNSSSFKLGEVPRERKRSVGGLGSPELDELQEKFRAITSSRPASSQTTSSQKTLDASSLPPRGDSFRPSLSRKEVPAPVRGKSFDSTLTPSSLDRSLYSQVPSSSSTLTAVELPGDDNVRTKKDASSPPPRPSTAQDSGFSPSQASESEMSPSLPPLNKSSMAGLGFEDEIKRVFGGGPNDSVPRRVSNSVKHGRSLSEAARSPYSPGLQYGDSPQTRDDLATLKQELRRSAQRIVELEAKLNNNASAKALEHNIQEKRNTVASLETEREAFLRELMVIKERLDASKEGKPLNFEELKSDLIRGLSKELEGLKETLKSDIQALVSQRDQLLEDVEMFGRLREQAIQETEQLNMKNAQLADLNNELTRRIQGQFQANKVPGLGIYEGTIDALDIKELDKRATPAATPTSSLATIGVPYSETSEGPEVFVAQKVSTFKNGAQQKKFFWKKPGATIMKGANKINRVFAADQEAANGYESSSTKSHGGMGGADKLFGSGQKKWGKSHKGGPTNGSGGPQEDNGHVAIFGGDLGARTAFEDAKIPIIVQKCIQEVEMRGMDYEGIYRKSGGTNQMRQIQDEFERGEDVQFSPDLDICSVTSVLKQYLRNLPNPLITFEVYDRFIETSNIYEDEKRVEALKAITEDLPPAHRDVLQFIIFHLARVAARKEQNLMNTRNLAVVFAPTLLRHLSDEREISDMHTKNNAVQFLIDYNEAIF